LNFFFFHLKSTLLFKVNELNLYMQIKMEEYIWRIAFRSDYTLIPGRHGEVRSHLYLGKSTDRKRDLIKCSGDYNIFRPLNCRGGFVTFGAPKVTKSACHQKGFFAARGLYPANQAKPRAAIFCPAVAPCSRRFSKSCYALSRTQSAIVLPGFARSWSDDGKERKNLFKSTPSMPVMARYEAINA
jgi:hypothetical protein